jgi:hypothetical protein
MIVLEVLYALQFRQARFQTWFIQYLGRTGRAGRTGKAVTFFTEDDVVNLRRYVSMILRLIQTIQLLSKTVECNLLTTLLTICTQYFNFFIVVMLCLVDLKLGHC